MGNPPHRPDSSSGATEEGQRTLEVARDLLTPPEGKRRRILARVLAASEEQTQSTYDQDSIDEKGVG